MSVPVEPEVAIARRAFPKAQELLAGGATRRVQGLVTTGWYGTEVHRESGAFALVLAGGTHDDLIGEVLRVTWGGRSVYVYCLGSADLPVELGLTRRAFAGLAVLAKESIDAVVEVV